MAEYISSGEVVVERAFKVSMNYEEFCLTEDAARELRDALNQQLGA